MSRSIEFGPESVLVVDDDTGVRTFLARALGRHGHSVEAFSSAEQALEAFRPGEHALVLSDLRMPGHDGLWLLGRLMEADSETAVIMVTASRDLETAVECLTRGAANYISKPVDLAELLEVVRRALENRRLRVENRFYRQDLERMVGERTARLKETMQALESTSMALEKAYRESIYRLVAAAEYRDEETGNHILRVGGYAQAIARGLGCDDALCKLLLLASPMHDVGKVGIPDAILLKPARLTPEEFEVVKTHCEIGARILAASESPLLQLAEVIALTHHEWFDGRGYPRGLKGEDIPLAGRIAALADAYDALTTKRVYKPAYPMEKALSIITEESGSHFDPLVVAAFEAVFEEILEIGRQFEDGEGPRDLDGAALPGLLSPAGKA